MNLSSASDAKSIPPAPNLRPTVVRKRGGGHHKKPGGGGYRGTLKGHGPDRIDIQFSKTMAWILRHAGQTEGLPMRPDGYARVHDLLKHEMLRGLDFAMLEKIVKNDGKQRYTLTYEPGGVASDVWWIRANQGHSIEVEVSMKQIFAALEIPMAVHGTTLEAWEKIQKQGLSRMNRQHIHLAQDVLGENVVSGMRKSSKILIYIDVRKALSAGIKFYASSNGVVLTPGDEFGLLDPRFFKRVEITNADRRPLRGWEGEQRGSGEMESTEDLETDASNLPQVSKDIS